MQVTAVVFSFHIVYESLSTRSTLFIDILSLKSTQVFLRSEFRTENLLRQPQLKIAHLLVLCTVIKPGWTLKLVLQVQRSRHYNYCSHQKTKKFNSSEKFSSGCENGQNPYAHGALDKDAQSR